MSKWARRTDNNHAEIRDGLRRLGYRVADTHRLGKSYPDLVVADKKRMLWVEVKGETGELSEGQVKFITQWLGHVIVATTVEDVVRGFNQET